jgi:prolyl-tRNA editing enzyme YbaK/EbsC (Cys-tRNA(Pro) deacylase)
MPHRSHSPQGRLRYSLYYGRYHPDLTPTGANTHVHYDAPVADYHPAVDRVRSALTALGAHAEVHWLSDSARTAAEAAAGLGVEVGQIASSIIFALPDQEPLLVVTSGRHRVDTTMVAELLGVEKLLRADADFVRAATGFAIGGVSPVAHARPITTLVDQALADYEQVWAAAGHPHAVFPTTFAQLLSLTGGAPAVVGE